MEIMQYILNEIIKAFYFLPPIIGSGLSIYIVPKTIRNFSQKNKNKKRNWKLYQQTPNEIPEKTPFIELLFNRQNIHNLEEILKQTNYPKELTQIIDTFKNYVSKENFQTCIKNLQTVKINHITLENDMKIFMQNLLSLTTAAGTYNPYDNTINLYSDKINEQVLSHEFLHMASSKGEKSGFRLITRFENTEIGRGLNEGYTELLNTRIWKYEKNSYKYNVKITRLIETFFDNPKDMENAYFNNDLDEVFKQFLKYGTKEEFFEIMTNLDNLATTKQIIFNKLDNIKTQLKLYEIIKRSNDQEKITNFENILDENEFIKKLRNGKIVLDKPYLKSKTK